MPDLLEQMYCSQQINIPPNLPFILKQYAKAAIRTQPYDLLYWSAAYFRAKANNLPPPVKERLEYPPVDSPSRLSPGFLKVLHKQLGHNEEVSLDVLYEKWLGVCLVREALDSMLKVGGFYTKALPWLKFVAVAAGHLSSSLKRTMATVCEVVTEEPDGGSAMIPVETFVTLYQFLARLNCGPKTPPSIPLPTETGSIDSELKTLDKKELLTVPGVEMDVGEKDSMAGLMVWPDVRPPEQPAAPRSPHYADEIGASSEYGLEVLDEAKGPVVDIITLYPVQPSIEQSQACIHPTQTPSSSIKFKGADEGILSHSSLKENEDWIKIPGRDFDENIVESEDSGMADDSEEATTSKGEETGQVTIDESDDTSAPTEIAGDKSEMEVEHEGAEDEKSFKSKSVGKSISHVSRQEILEQSVSVDFNENTESIYVNNDHLIEKTDKVVSESSKKSNNSSPLLEKEYYSEDSVITPGERVTVQRFFKDNNKSANTYSTGEIRGGFIGNKSGDKIERDSSVNTIKAAETVQRFSAVEDESSEFLPVPRETESFESDELKSFIVLEDDGQVVAGIGPVIPEPQILAVVEYMYYWASKQQGMVMPRNINHILCPPLDLPPNGFDDENKQSRY